MPGRLFILNFHGLGTPTRELTAGERRVRLAEPQFQEVLDFVKTQSDLELTFDDANESDFTVALPALQARGMKAQFFLVARRIGQPGYLSPAQVRSLSAAGMALGNHGMRHRPWVALGDRELHEELVEARDCLEQLAGVKIDQASCPFGTYNRRVVRALRGASYKGIYTSDGGPAQPGALILPRNSVCNTWTLESVRRVLSDEVAPLRRLLRDLKLTIKRWR